MKRLAILALVALVFSVGYAGETNDDKRLEAFLGKLEKFNKNKNRASSNWTMPNTNPEANTDNMPTGNIQYLDHETGLQYSPSSGKIFDPELNIELDVVTGIVYDFKTKKEYSLEDLQAERSKKL